MTRPRILALATAVPPHRWTQQDVVDSFGEHFPRYREPRIQRIFQGSGIETRHFVIDRASFDPSAGPDDLHALFLSGAQELGEAAAHRALDQARLDPGDVDYLVATTCTGYVCPGLTARLGAVLGLPDHLQRADLVGMGCAGAMPSLQRAHDFVRAHPGRRALVVCVEVASACWFVDDTLETVVGNTLCGDGAAAAVIGADEGLDTPTGSPALERFATLLDAALLDSVGLEFRAGRQRIVLDKELRTGAGPLVARAVERLLEESGLGRDEIDHWIVHSGGRRVLDGIDEALGFEDDELVHSRSVLRTHGNMSSPTLLFVLERSQHAARPGDVGVLVALGPGLAAETGILRW